VITVTKVNNPAVLCTDLTVAETRISSPRDEVRLVGPMTEESKFLTFRMMELPPKFRTDFGLKSKIEGPEQSFNVSEKVPGST